MIGAAQLKLQTRGRRPECKENLTKQHDGPPIRGIGQSEVDIVQRAMLHHSEMKRSEIEEGALHENEP